ncbi:MAG: hypothetical protein EXS32_09015 [Opitutus sp.]|nr:hypothetical protein [Opitutus sp.]
MKTSSLPSPGHRCLFLPGPVAWARVCVFLLFLAGAAKAQTSSAADVETLLAGVAQIPRVGAPGGLIAFGEQAFPVLATSADANSQQAVVAAARYGSGRAVAFSHDGYLVSDLRDAGFTALLTNAVNWSANKTGPRVGVIGVNGLVARLQAAGFNAANTTAGALAGFDVICLTPNTTARADITALQAFAQAGGGLVVAFTGWGWASLNPTRSLAEDFPGNWLLNPAGIAWTPDALSAPANLPATPRPPALIHAQRALDAAVAAVAPGGTALSAANAALVSGALTVALASLPAADTLFRPRFATVLASASVNRVPTPQNPVTAANVLGRAAIVDEFRRLALQPADQVTAHPAAAVFPGAVSATAPRVTRSVPILASRPRRQSTGLYAAPGQVVTVRLPAAGLGRNFSVRIGAHTDRLWQLDSWPRHPEISRSWPLTQAETRVASPFGGLIYLERTTADSGANFDVEISGAVAAPHYVRGKNTVAEWRSTLRQHAAPWGEIESDKMIVTTEGGVLAALDDPEAVAAVWDAVLDSEADLAVMSRVRASPERFVVDQEISAGYMHAGYPLMAHLDVKTKLVNAAFILSPATNANITRQGDQNWGFFHEVGHNHQSPDWTFDGTGEVTVNLFSLYAFDKVVGQPVAENSFIDAARRQREFRAYNFDNPDFERWKTEPFLALSMYVQLQLAFGWDAYKAVFAEYRGLAAADRPRTEQEKRDQWMVRFSRQIGRNLGPFFQRWGVPTTEAARASLVHLPVWMSDEVMPATTVIYTQPLASQQVSSGRSVTLSVAAVGTPAPTYQWTRDGFAIPGATTFSYTIPAASAADAGTYRVVVTSGTRTTTSEAAAITVVAANPGRLINLSVLTSVAPAPDSFTMGYVVGGNATVGAKPLVIRAAGPSLGAFGVPGTLDDPKLETFAGSIKTGENDNWGGSATLTSALAAVGAFAYTGPASKDAALTASITTRDNSVVVSSATATGGGTVIAELYDATPTPAFTVTTPRLINVSVRKHLGTGLTVGFVLGGSVPTKVLVRAVGPTLGVFGVPGPVDDSQLTLFNDKSVKIGENNDWGGTAELTAAFGSVGAFGLPATSKDAAVFLTLPPGLYSVQVSGTANSTGVALVEVYEVP